ncbi:TRAP transporter small permease [Acidocella sp. KAb 2-4]|uniref:TRAP transporter small permease n=1 Tax=Acidocella sp. KAb 2-4 TaxID=2885158 RepID=UPI001D06B127|nr:TRAP transporter small permease [Acidocella sp. KAb 2-4]MCB5945905.1 TRAP transporter small permease [Acidocella sp. KAb 2-4]
MVHVEYADALESPEPGEGTPGKKALKYRPVALIRKVLSFIVAASILGVVIVTVLNVVMRNVFGKPLIGSDDIIQLILPVLIFAALPLVTANESHFSVNILVDRLKGRVRSLQSNIVRGVTLISVCLIVYELIEETQSLYAGGVTTNVLNVSMGPLFWILTGLSVVTGLLVFMNILITILGKGS